MPLGSRGVVAAAFGTCYGMGADRHGAAGQSHPPKGVDDAGIGDHRPVPTCPETSCPRTATTARIAHVAQPLEDAAVLMF